MPQKRRKKIDINKMNDEELERWVYEHNIKPYLDRERQKSQIKSITYSGGKKVITYRGFAVNARYHPEWRKNYYLIDFESLPGPVLRLLRAFAIVYLRLRGPVRKITVAAAFVLAFVFFASLAYMGLSLAANVYWTVFPPAPQEYVAAVNAYRVAHNVSPLMYELGVAARAQQGAEEWTEEHDMRLIPPGCGEVLLVAYPVMLWPGGPAGYAVYEFDRSPPHRAVLLDPRYRYIGVGQSWRLIGAKIVIQLCENPG